MPSFSPEGSNERMQEEKTYRLFLNYMKEVAGECDDERIQYHVVSHTDQCYSYRILLYILGIKFPVYTIIYTRNVVALMLLLSYIRS